MRGGSGHGLDLLDRAGVHAPGEPLLIEGLGQRDQDGPVGVAVPVAGRDDGHQDHLVGGRDRDDAASLHPQQVGDVADRLPLEGEADLPRAAGQSGRERSCDVHGSLL